MFVDVIIVFSFYCYNYSNAAYPAVYGQFPQAIPQPLAAVAPSQREGKLKMNREMYTISVKCFQFYPKECRQEEEDTKKWEKEKLKLYELKAVCCEVFCWVEQAASNVAMKEHSNLQ